MAQGQATVPADKTDRRQKEALMIIKNYTKTGNFCRVTFKLTSEVQARQAVLCGEFNNWNKEAAEMKPLKEGGFSVTLALPTGRAYRFRYLLDDTRWENDWEADGYLPNDFGSEDSVVRL